MSWFSPSLIGDHVAPVDCWDPQKTDGEDSFTYIDISSVDRTCKEIVSPPEVRSSEAPSRARQLVERGDVLVSTVRPALNAVAYVTSEFHAATASTGFCVLRPLPSRLDGRYLYHWVRTPQFIANLASRATGASYPAASDAIVKRSKLPLPPLLEQRRIAAILDKADAIRRKRREAIRLTEALLRSAFLEMFGDPVTNLMGWDVIPFGKLVPRGFRNGLSPSKGGHVLFQVLTLSSVTGERFNRRGVKEGRFSTLPGTDKLVRSGDFLICRGNGNLFLVGRGHFPPGDLTPAVFPDTIIAAGIDLRLLDPAFFESLWASSLVRRQIEQKARTTSGIFKVNQAMLKETSVIVPPFGLQKQFSEIAKRIDGLRAGLSHTGSCELSDSLVQRAFRGDL